MLLVEIDGRRVNVVVKLSHIFTVHILPSPAYTAVAIPTQAISHTATMTAGLLCTPMSVSSFRGTQLSAPASRVVVGHRAAPLVEAAQVLQGKVVSTKCPQSPVVAVDSFKPHPIYKKAIRTTKTFVVHDPENRAELNDLVEIVPSRPISKRKRFVLGDVVAKSK